MPAFKVPDEYLEGKQKGKEPTVAARDGSQPHGIGVTSSTPKHTKKVNVSTSSYNSVASRGRKNTGG